MRRGLIRVIVIVVVALLLALLFVFLLSGRVNAAGGHGIVCAALDMSAVGVK
jgi:hypothetical protein